ncbi:hypothetical protein Cgig2_022496 [Carnegiea gigantea]|uniref:Outer envelope protein 61 n=1 Tax=Carnegiea gigantea TaxID=171969 RepID=A0A9Q1KAG0_9CARY|nr:hypothetical protein Cgig2_022496 [Carnegiea gigantea]
MFNGMMDPELMRLAQEQMSRMSPDEFAKIQQQMMSNPDLLKMASESMMNMRPEDLKLAAEQLKHVRPQDMAEIREKMANASPEEIASIRARADAHMTYVLNGAEMLKKQGNALHSQGKYHDAAEKYLLAKKNLKEVPDARGRAIQLACSLNLMSCYLKKSQYRDCIEEGSEVLMYDRKNVKALYRRGQAYKELGQLKEAVSDLSEAHEVSPDDDTIAEVLRAAKECLGKEGGVTRTSTGLVIEEITEAESLSSENHRGQSLDHRVAQPGERSGQGEQQTEPVGRGPADPEVLARMGSGNTGDIPVDMLKTTTSMISRMSPEELQNMVKMASSFQGGNPYVNGPPFGNNFGPGSIPPNLSPDMLKTAGDLMSRMSPDELQRMFEIASSFKQRDSVATPSSSSSGASSLESNSKLSETRKSATVDKNDIIGQQSQPSGSHSSARSSFQPSFPPSMGDLQEQMRSQMKDPAMRQMFSSMLKNMSPEMMADMSEQFGLKLSKEDAAKAQEAMASLSPEALDQMMRWADRVQRGAEGVKAAKNWLLGRRGMILAICMLILAVILHRLGFIGS